MVLLKIVGERVVLLKKINKLFVLPAFFALFFSLVLFGCVNAPKNLKGGYSNFSSVLVGLPSVKWPLSSVSVTSLTGSSVGVREGLGLKNFGSWRELFYFLRAGEAGGFYGGVYGGIKTLNVGVPLSAQVGESGGVFKAREYSTTNVQVEGVDEADVVKNDGEFLYLVVKNEKIVILKAFPPSGMRIVSEIPFNLNLESSGKTGGEFGLVGGLFEKRRLNANVNEIFVNDGKLVAFGSEYYEVSIPLPYGVRSISENAGENVGENVGASSSLEPGVIVAREASVERKGSVEPVKEPVKDCVKCVLPRFEVFQAAFVKVYDVSDKRKPRLLKTVRVPNGYYANSRMIGSRVYGIFSQPAFFDGLPPFFFEDEVVKSVDAREIAYFDEVLQPPFQFTSILSIDLNDLNVESKTVLMGEAQNVFASSKNLYVVYTRRSYRNPWFEVVWRVVSARASTELKRKAAAIDELSLPGWVKNGLKNNLALNFLNELTQKNAESARALQEELNKETQRAFEEEATREKTGEETERTVIQKFSLENGLKYEGGASVKGSVLNQFSMDEWNGLFRIATTTEEVWERQQVVPQPGMPWFRRLESKLVKPRLNHLFVLDSKLNVVGKLEDIAPGESIYSARFIGDRAYLVTFKKTDPLFVISLKDARNPKILGKLKIPGYSDYLHPFDETRLIGLGKQAVEAKEGDFAWYQGVKLSLFDVSDVEHPKEVAKYEIGDRGTDSNALHDHKAFLFDKNKNLLVIPILLAKIDESKYPEGVPDNAYGDFVFQGAFVFTVTRDAITLRGTVSHASEEDLLKSGYYWFSDSSVKRSAFIENVLYTISNNFVKANDLTSLEVLNYVQINSEKPPFPPFATTASAQLPATPAG